jgi:hypothetical protein
MHIEDRKQIEAGAFQSGLWPNTWAGVDHQMSYGRSDYMQFDMSGTGQVRGETTSMTIRFGQLIDMPSTATFATET